MSQTISERRLEANRRNAQLSTGPRTPEGKARVARNRTTHALTGAHVILPGEDPAAFENLRDALFEEHTPATETESHQVDLLAQNQWKFRRAALMEVKALTESAGELTDQVMRVARYTASIRRTYTQALTELRRLKATREAAERAALAAALDRRFLRKLENASNPPPPLPPPTQPEAASAPRNEPDSSNPSPQPQPACETRETPPQPART